MAALAPALVLELAAARGARRTPLERAATFAPWLVVCAAYLALRHAALAGAGPGAVGLSAGERASASVQALGSYAFDVAVPCRGCPASSKA